MNRSIGSSLSRRGLGRLLAAAPLGAKGAKPAEPSPAEQARERRSANRAQMKAVELPREVEPSFRFEP